MGCLSEEDRKIVIPTEHGTVIDKEVYTAYCKELREYIEKNNILKIYLRGIDIDCCVLKTAFDLFETKYSDKTFENIKHIDEYGNEYWLARELQSILTYKEWRKFENVINKAKNSCDNSGININDHFVEADKMVEIGSGAKRKQKDYILTRYACYLIAQNGDSRKKVIALAQTYFAIQTRRQEITEQEYDALSDDEKRFYQRKLTKQGNYTLQKAAINAGVKNMAEFHNAGYKGLYNGETADDIFKRKKLRYREDILDNHITRTNKSGNLDALSGFIKCHNCNGQMVLKIGKNKSYYYCTNYFKKKCTSHSIEKSKLENMISDELKIDKITRKYLYENVNAIYIKNDKTMKVDFKI